MNVQIGRKRPSLENVVLVDPDIEGEKWRKAIAIARSIDGDKFPTVVIVDPVDDRGVRIPRAVTNTTADPPALRKLGSSFAVPGALGGTTRTLSHGKL